MLRILTCVKDSSIISWPTEAKRLLTLRVMKICNRVDRMLMNTQEPRNLKGQFIKDNRDIFEVEDMEDFYFEMSDVDARIGTINHQNCSAIVMEMA